MRKTKQRRTNHRVSISFFFKISFPYVKSLIKDIGRKSAITIYDRYLSTRHQTRRGNHRRTPFLIRNYGAGSRGNRSGKGYLDTIEIIPSSFSAVRSSAKFPYQRQGEPPPRPSSFFSRCCFLSLVQCQGESANRSICL